MNTETILAKLTALAQEHRALTEQLDLESEPLCEQALEEIGEAESRAKDDGFTPSSRQALRAVRRKWTTHPLFLGGRSQLGCCLLNELEFSLADDESGAEAWDMIAELAATAHRNADETLKDSLRISNLEIAAEPREFELTLRLLFSLASDPDTRWAVFAAYENFPWRLRPHAAKYSNGTVTPKDVDDWLASRGLDGDEFLMGPAPHSFSAT